MQTNSKSQKTVRLVELALIIAIIIVMAFTPIGYIKTFGLELTLIVIPVAVGSILLGPKGGAVLGVVFGITSFLQCFGISHFGTTIVAIDPVKGFITCFVPRVFVGLFTGLIYAGLKKTKIKSFAEVIASLCCPLINTVLFMTFLTFFFYNTDFMQGIAQNLEATNPFNFILLFVGIQGTVEAILTFIVGSAVSKALVHVNNKYLNKV